jgi:hypothetical protein
VSGGFYPDYGGGFDVGGLVGKNLGAVSESYATGNVAGAGNGVGGLVGESAGAISKSYATGSVTGGGLEVGGLVGKNDSSLVSNSYATGNVSGAGDVGGLVGYNTGAVSTSYSTGSVTAAGRFGTNFGGLVGYGGADGVTDSFWNVTTSGLPTSAGGTGLTTAQMQTESTFTAAGWNFTSIWYMPADSYPLLLAFMPSP